MPSSFIWDACRMQGVGSLPWEGLDEKQHTCNKEQKGNQISYPRAGSAALPLWCPFLREFPLKISLSSPPSMPPLLPLACSRALLPGAGRGCWAECEPPAALFKLSARQHRQGYFCPVPSCAGTRLEPGHKMLWL